MTELKFGITLDDGRPALEEARRAEALGFDSLWTGEHVVWHHPVHDSLMKLAAVAAVTQRVRIGTSILLLSLKHPVLMCKAVTTLDHISGGRASLGIGIGGEYTKEFEALGIPVQERGPRANESIRLMKRLWTEDSVTFRGRFFQVDDVGLRPHPVQKPHPPILVGGRRRALRRTALYGDGWMPYMYTPEMYREDWGKIEEMALEAGRDPATIERTLWAPITIAESYEAAAKMSSAALGSDYQQSFDSIVHKYGVLGTPEQCADRLAQYVDAGAEHILFALIGPDDRARGSMETIAGEVIPLLQKAYR